MRLRQKEIESDTDQPVFDPKRTAPRRWNRISIGTLLLVIGAVGILLAWYAEHRRKLILENEIYQSLVKQGVEIENTSSLNAFEKLSGLPLKPSNYRAKIRYDQNRFLYLLSRLRRLEELDVTLGDNQPNLMMLDRMVGLKVLRVREWYRPLSLDGVQELHNLEILDIHNVETPKTIDLSALANHPALKEFWIAGYQLDALKKFQELPDW